MMTMMMMVVGGGGGGGDHGDLNASSIAQWKPRDQHNDEILLCNTKQQKK